MCGETSPAFITWLGEVNLSEERGGEGAVAGIASRDWKPTICQRHGGGVARGCLDGLGRRVAGRVAEGEGV